MVTLSRVSLKYLFKKAEDYELPREVKIDELGFYHWLSSRSNKAYIVFEERAEVHGIALSIAKHAGLQTRLRRCDLCGRFVEIADIVSLRSLAKDASPNVDYRALYSYVCRDTDTCRAMISEPEPILDFLAKHDGARGYRTLKISELPSNN